MLLITPQGLRTPPFRYQIKTQLTLPTPITSVLRRPMQPLGSYFAENRDVQLQYCQGTPIDSWAGMRVSIGRSRNLLDRVAAYTTNLSDRKKCQYRLPHHKRPSLAGFRQKPASYRGDSSGHMPSLFRQRKHYRPKERTWNI